jgi:hypothetical protein
MRQGGEAGRQVEEADDPQHDARVARHCLGQAVRDQAEIGIVRRRAAEIADMHPAIAAEAGTLLGIQHLPRRRELTGIHEVGHHRDRQAAECRRLLRQFAVGDDDAVAQAHRLAHAADVGEPVVEVALAGGLVQRLHHQMRVGRVEHQVVHVEQHAPAKAARGADELGQFSGIAGTADYQRVAARQDGVGGDQVVAAEPGGTDPLAAAAQRLDHVPGAVAEGAGVRRLVEIGHARRALRQVPQAVRKVSQP